MHGCACILGGVEHQFPLGSVTISLASVAAMSSLSDDSWIELAESNVDNWRDQYFCLRGNLVSIMQGLVNI